MDAIVGTANRSVNVAEQCDTGFLQRCPMNRKRPDEIAPPSFAPADAVRADTYPDAVEVLRSPKFVLDPTWEATSAFTGNSLFLLEGLAHISRRRVLNKLARPQALDWHREQVLLPLMERTLAELAASPDPDGVHRADLVPLLRRVFAGFAGAFVGCHEALTPEGGDALLDIFVRIEGGYRAKYVTDPAAKQAALDAAADARREFEQRFWDPALAEWRNRLGQLERGEISEE